MKRILLTSLTAFSLTLPVVALERYTPDYNSFHTDAMTFCVNSSSMKQYFGENQGTIMCTFVADCYAAKISKRLALKKDGDKARDDLYFECQKKVIKAMGYED